MKKWIRWQGLLVFVAVMAVVLVFWFLLVDKIVKSSIEKVGTAIVGAKVELNDADLSLIPLGIMLDTLKVTNPNEPMKNAIEFKKGVAAIDFGNLLMRKVIIDEMSLSGIQFNTDRKYSGAVKKTTKSKETEKKGFKLQLPSFEMPDVKEVLEKENLESLAAIKTLKEDIENAKAQWEEKLNSLPDKKKFENYKDRIDNLKSSTKGIGGVFGKASEVSSLKKDIEADISQIKQSLEDFKNQKESLNQKIQSLKNLPEKDIARLKEKYGFSGDFAQNFTKILFGEKVSNYVNSAIYWYEKLVPYLESGEEKDHKEKEPKKVRARGVDIKFKEYNPMPDFLITKSFTDMIIAGNVLAGEINNITSSQKILGKPLIFNFNAKSLKNAKDIKITGKIDHITSKSNDTLKASLEGVKLENLNLLDSRDVKIVMEEAFANLSLDAKIAGENLDVTINANVNSVNFSGMSEKERVSNILNIALGEITKFNLQAKISGKTDDYALSISSDIDKTMKNAMDKVIKDQMAEFEKKLKDEIVARVNIPLGGLQSQFKGLDNIENELKGRLDIGSDLTKMLKKF
jgi:uncharacterized protein (TIGR03545 family)